MCGIPMADTEARIRPKLNVTINAKVKQAALAYKADTGEGPAPLVNRLLAEFLTHRGYLKKSELPPP
jgi:hypothetical protein